MWIKSCKAKQYEYLNVVESKKVNGQTKHEVLFNLGRKDLIENNKIKYYKIAQTIMEYLGTEKIPDDANLYNYGYMLIEHIFNDLKLDKLLNNIKTNIKYDLVSTIKLMIFDRILKPQSKLKTFETQNKYLNIENVEQQNIYRSLDILHDHKNLIENHLFKNTQPTKYILYDVTTYAFESTNEDTLRKFGYSKDKKFNEVQIVMGLAVSNNMPISYDIFTGNTGDSKTLKQSLENIKNKYNKEVIIVADSGINCIDNILAIEPNGYIVSGRIKKFDKDIKSEMFKDDYTEINSEEEIFKYKEITIDKKIEKQTITQRIIFTYSSQRAKKDKKDRERLIKKARELIKEPSQIKSLNKRGGKKYIKSSNTIYEIDEEKIIQDEKYDGYHALVTNQTLSSEEIISEYHKLWKIEETFRVLKTTLESRPVYHWSPNRILGHFAMCYISLVILRTLESKLKNTSINDLIDCLNHLTVAELDLPEPKYLNINIPVKYKKILDQLTIKRNNRNKPYQITLGGQN